MEYWSVGVLECWSVESPHRLEADGSPYPKAASLHHSITPSLHHSITPVLLQLLSFDLRVMRARFGS
jgi:hypothetical protein